MNIHSTLEWLQNTPFALTISQNGYLFPWVECAHVIALSLVVGTIAIVDLRLLGFASLKRPVTSLMRQVLPITWTAFAVALLTGGTLFASDATEYWENAPFRFKFIAMGLAAVNMLVFHFVTSRNIATWNEATRTPWAAKTAGAISMLLWISIVAFGRWIGFTVGE
jgi:Family of unknown function (DUF6644)